MFFLISSLFLDTDFFSAAFRWRLFLLISLSFGISFFLETFFSWHPILLTRFFLDTLLHPFIFSFSWDVLIYVKTKVLSGSNCKACTKYFPVLHWSTLYYKTRAKQVLPSTTLYYKACTKPAQSSSQYYFVLHKAFTHSELLHREALTQKRFATSSYRLEAFYILYAKKQGFVRFHPHQHHLDEAIWLWCGDVVIWGCGDVVMMRWCGDDEVTRWWGDVVMRWCCDVMVIDFLPCHIFRITEFRLLSFLWALPLSIHLYPSSNPIVVSATLQVCGVKLLRLWETGIA